MFNKLQCWWRGHDYEVSYIHDATGTILKQRYCTTCYNKELETEMTWFRVHSKDKDHRDVYVDYVKEHGTKEQRRRSLLPFELDS